MEGSYLEKATEILNVLNLYFKYFYPGFISIWVYNFLCGKRLKENSKTIIKSILLSYIFCLVTKNDFILIIISIIIPYSIYLILDSKMSENLLKRFKIRTNINDTAIELIDSKEKDKSKPIFLKVFLDDKKIMYEGNLRVYQSDKDSEQAICLSGYRRYVMNEDGSIRVLKDYSGDSSRWVLIKNTDISRIEVKYCSNK